MALRNKLLFLVLATLLVVSQATEEVEFKYEEGVLILTDKNFEAAIQKFDYMLVEFYAPWCGHCKQLQPEYESAAKILSKQETGVVLAKVDATVEKDLAERFEVEGFPTLKFFVLQNPIDYTGGRTENEIIQWISKKTAAPSSEIREESQLQQFQQENKALFVLFMKQEMKKELDLFNKIVRNFEELGFAYTTVPSLTEKYLNDKEIALYVFKQFDEKQAQMLQELNEENLITFIEQHELPTVMDFSQRAAEKIFGENNPALFLLYAKGCPQSQKARDILQEIAPQVKSTLLISETTISEGLGERLGEYIGISSKELPAFRIVAPKDDDVKKYYFDGELTAANVLAFVESYKAGTLKPVFKSEDIPEKNDQPVKIIVGKTWDSIVKDTTKDVLVEFYAPWCGHCKTLAPIYDKLAEKLKGNENIVIAKIDATANEIENVPIQGFPTLRFYPSNNKEGVEYEGDRTEAAFLEFLQKNTTFKWAEVDQVTDL